MWTGPKFKEKKTALLRSMTVFTVLASGSALALLPGNVFWPYFAGLVILLIGATGVSGDVLAARGWDKIVALGPVCYGVPLAVFGAVGVTVLLLVLLVYGPILGESAADIGNGLNYFADT